MRDCSSRRRSRRRPTSAGHRESTSDAARDVDAIKAYIAERNAAAATRVTGRLIAAIERLRVAPHQGRPGRVAVTRELVVLPTPYIVAYRILGDEAHVLRVIHAAQRWPEDM